MNAEANTAFNLYQVVKVRRLSGLYEVVESWITGAQRNKKRRYRLKAVPNSGAIVEATEAFAEDMQAAPAPEPVQELTLVPDPEAPSPAELLESAVVRPFTTPAEFMMDEGAFGGDLDEYSPGAQGARETVVEAAPEPKVQAQYRLPRYSPRGTVELERVLYRGIVFGTDGSFRPEGEEFVRWTIYVTEETNGFIVWIKSINAKESRLELEEFYPHADGTRARDAALEHGILLALKQVEPKPCGLINQL